MNYKLSYFNKLYIVLAVNIAAVLFFLVFFISDSNEYIVANFYLTILAISICSLLFLQKKIIIFEPVILFSIYYLTVLIAGVYFIQTNYEMSRYVNNTTFNNSIFELTNSAFFYYLIGYVCMVCGYYSIKEKNLTLEIHFEDKRIISDMVINIVIIVFMTSGLLNFAYNILKYANGNLWVYMINISSRAKEFADEGSTLLYLLSYTAMYVWLFKLIRNNVAPTIWFNSFLLVTILMKASTGRIFATMLHIFSFVAIYYFIEISRKGLNNKKYLLSSIFVFIIGGLLYFFRLFSNLLYIGQMNSKDLYDFVEMATLGFANLLIDSGNLPNIPIFLKIIDAWEPEFDYLYGTSFFTWIQNILPASIRTAAYQPSVMIKQTWYPHVTGGNLPPTGIGEMYANFGFLGPIVGMFMFGAFAAILYNYMIKSKNYWFLVVYVQIAIGFIMLYPKGEFDNLTLWFVVPIFFTYWILRILTFIF